MEQQRAHRWLTVHHFRCSSGRFPNTPSRDNTEREAVAIKHCTSNGQWCLCSISLLFP
jgi:hypothetical protein